MSDRRYDVNRYLRKDFRPSASRSSGMLDGDVAEKAVFVVGGLVAGGVLMHFAHKHNWLGMGQPAASAPTTPPAQLPASTGGSSTAAPPAASRPAAGVRVVNVGG